MKVEPVQFNVKDFSKFFESEDELVYVCDKQRHLVCLPYSIDNLHTMAENLDINRAFYENKKGKSHPHYDIPAKRIKEIQAKCIIVSPRAVLMITKGQIKNLQELLAYKK